MFHQGQFKKITFKMTKKNFRRPQKTERRILHSCPPKNRLDSEKGGNGGHYEQVTPGRLYNWRSKVMDRF